jgi:four helix bundle protein
MIGGMMDSEQLKGRTKKLAIDIIRLSDTLQKSDSTTILNRQIIRSATSVAANYRAACRARSKADFINKLGIVEEEADETLFWLEMFIESGKVKKENIASLYKEVDEIVAIFSASHKTAKENRFNKS